MSLASFFRGLRSHATSRQYRQRAELPANRFRPCLEQLEGRALPSTSLAVPLHFDFGTSSSAVAPGYTGVSLVPYSSSQGYGWQSLTGLSALDRGTSNPLTSDFVQASSATFLVNLANGTYDVTPTLGDALASRDNVSVYGQGKLLASGLASSAGQFLRPTYQVNVTNGQLNLRLLDSGGASPSFALDALDIVAVSPTQGSAKVYAPTTGVYVLGIPNASASQSLLTNPYVDGLAVRAMWNFIEPTPGAYNWSYLDSVINAAAAAGKKVSLSITAGINTPSWVYSAGAQAFSFVDSSSSSPQTIPIPWDPVFLAQWKGMIQQLGARYACNAALTHVKITGINYNTAETFLPHSQGVSVTQGTSQWTTTNDVANWQAAGYTRTKLENAWQTVADAWSQAFPNQQISSMLVVAGFPPIDNNGNVFACPQGGDTQVVTDLINRGMARYGTQFIAQNNGLSDTWIMPQVTGAADQVTTGHQMLWWVTGDSTYAMNNGTAIDPATAFQNAVNSAVAAHARFLEVYSQDVGNAVLQGVLANAHAALTGNALPLAMITGLPAPGSVLEGINTLALGSALADPSATSSAGFTYAWSVLHKGQIVATGSAPTLTFTAADNGDYVVSLQVIDPLGQSSWVNAQTITIVTVPPTITQLAAPLSLTQGLAATFSAAATDPAPAHMAGGLTYTWKFGNGDTATGSSVSYTYKWTGTFTITLIVTDANGGNTTSTGTITVGKPTHSPEGAPIALSASAFPAPTGASFTGATYAWTVTKNGSAYATGSAANFTFTPNDTSSYVVTLTVTDATGKSWTSVSTYVIDNLAPTITSISAPSTVAKGTAAAFAATATDPGQADMSAGLVYSWRFGDTGTATGSSVSHVYSAKGTFTVTLTVTDQWGAKTTSQFQITVV
jgi:PKD repeat protein